MIDKLQEESPEDFTNPDKTFVDLYIKSGLYIAEIVKRLYVGLEDKQMKMNAWSIFLNIKFMVLRQVKSFIILHVILSLGLMKKLRILMPHTSFTSIQRLLLVVK